MPCGMLYETTPSKYRTNIFRYVHEWFRHIWKFCRHVKPYAIEKNDMNKKYGPFLNSRVDPRTMLCGMLYETIDVLNYSLPPALKVAFTIVNS